MPATMLIQATALCALLSPTPPHATIALPQTHDARSTPSSEGFRHEPPKELFEVKRVVDGDTIHVQYRGKLEKLRLLSVDTEERFDVGPTKPRTVFGEECAAWAEEFFKNLETDESPSRVGLAFPGGAEKRDIYGRLLCHVVLEDGTDFNLLLVELGKSPYFNKYGHSRICHEAFVEAQEAARKEKLGIWNPDTNKPAKPGAPAAKRPYRELLEWWQIRAEAIDGFREKNAEMPRKYIDAEDPEALQAALDSGAEVEIFCSINQHFDEEDGSRTYLMRSGDKRRALRVKIAASDLEAHDRAFDFEGLRAEFRQNYVWVRGKVTRGPRGFDIWSKSAKQWKLAGRDIAASKAR